MKLEEERLREGGGPLNTKDEEKGDLLPSSRGPGLSDDAPKTDEDLLVSKREVGTYIGLLEGGPCTVRREGELVPRRKGESTSAMYISTSQRGDSI